MIKVSRPKKLVGLSKSSKINKVDLVDIGLMLGYNASLNKFQKQITHITFSDHSVIKLEIDDKRITKEMFRIFKNPSKQPGVKKLQWQFTWN